jgi:hemolysin activation/secretion protein
MGRPAITLGCTIGSTLMFAALAASAEERFDVLELRVLGNTVLAAEQIERVVYPHLGPGKTVQDVEAARLALEGAYKDAGYGTVFVDIPEQDVGGDGIVRLHVTEGRLDRVRIAGARYFSNGALRASLPALGHGQVPHLPTVQKELNAANRQTADRNVTPVLRAGRVPGTIDVELKVKDELPVHGAIEVNDRHTADTSRTRTAFNLSYDNLWQRFHSLSLQYQTAPEERQEARVIAAAYSAPVTRSGHLISLSAVDTNSDVATVGTLSVLGAGRIYGGRYVIPLPPADGFYHSVSLGPDYKDFEESIDLLTGESDRTPITYMSWSALYGGGTYAEASNSSFNIGTTFGIRSLSNDPEEFEFKRFHARPNFFYLRGGAQYEHVIWWGTRLFVRLAGQYAVEPLISNEQFSIGGADSVRGYLESETLGDTGVAGTLEWRTPDFAQYWKWLQRFDGNLYLFGFADAGLVSIIDPLPGQESSVDLSSVGLGVRFTLFGGLQAAIDGAYTLRATDRTDAYDTRLHFLLRYGF